MGAFRAADRSISLLPMLMVHAITCPHLQPLLRSRWPLLTFLANVIPTPKRRHFPSKRLLMRHVLELARPCNTTLPCPPVSVRYESETIVAFSKGKGCIMSNIRLQKPLVLIDTHSPLSPIQQTLLAALAPLLCLPYADSALRGDTRRWVMVLLLAWAKIAIWKFNLPEWP